MNIKFQEENGTKVKFNQYCANMFANYTDRLSSINSLDFSGADTSNVTYMSWMFSDCHNLTSIDVSKFDTKNVTNISGMFSNCHGLTYINADKKSFNTKNLSSWRREAMFSGCINLLNQQYLEKQLAING